MKKIYLSITALAFCVAANAQNAVAPSINAHKAVLAPNAKIPSKVKSALARTQNGPFAVQIDPIEQVMTQKSVDISSTTPQEDTFLSSVFMDSTVSVASGGTTLQTNDDIFLGTTLDPKSAYLQASFLPLVSASDPYNIDSIFIHGSYIKKTADTDTLYVWLVWGDTANTAVYNKALTNTAWLPPLATFRRSVIGPKIAGSIGAYGNKCSPAAPATNKKLVKYVLQPEDSTARGYGYSKIISVPFTSSGAPAGVTIPAGNIVTCMYTFVPGGTHTLNQPMYSFTTSIVPTINGYCGIVWGQTDVAALADYKPYQVDTTSWNMGVYYGHKKRHALGSATANANSNGDVTSAPNLYFSITGTASVGLKEYQNKGFALSQNTPNPFNGESKVSYLLDKDAHSATFTVTDVMGRVISTQTVDAAKGTHTVNLSAQAAGVYYYSLNVDGNVTTKKMIAQ